MDVADRQRKRLLLLGAAGVVSGLAIYYREELAALLRSLFGPTPVPPQPVPRPGPGEEWQVVPRPPTTQLPTLRRGSTGPYVTFLQARLTDLGFSPGPVDGVFGPQTEAAVKAFQSAYQLAVDGIVGPQTWGALLSGTFPVLRRGSTGPYVLFVQARLTDLGYSVGPLDGIFGPRTEQAVIEFQRAHGVVPANGVVDSNTWAALTA